MVRANTETKSKEKKNVQKSRREANLNSPFAHLLEFIDELAKERAADQNGDYTPESYSSATIDIVHEVFSLGMHSGDIRNYLDNKRDR